MWRHCKPAGALTHTCKCNCIALSTLAVKQARRTGVERFGICAGMCAGAGTFPAWLRVTAG